ncbi:hypothetical protein DV735_g3556, partial [Chaetothyriales sp. CBS 134920]
MSTGFAFGGAPSSAPGSKAATTTTTAGSAGSLFGTSTAPSANLFGSGSTGLSFGGTGPVSFGSAGDKPLFAAPSTDTTPASSSAGFSFTPAPTSGASSSSLFTSPKPTPSSQSTLTSSTPAPTTSGPKFGFGNPSTTPAGPPPSASTFAASTGGSSAPLFPAASKSADNKSSTPGFSFSTTPSQKSATNASTQSKSNPATATNIFGGAKSSTTQSSQPASTQPAAPNPFAPSQPASTQASTLSPFGTPSSTTATSSAPKPAFSFPSATSQPASSAPATASAAAKPLFGAATTTAGPSAAVATAPAKPFFGAATTTTTEASSSAATTTAPAASAAPAFAGFGKTTATAPATSSADPKAVASTAGPPPPPQSRLKNKTMDEILTRWATDLTKYTKEFKNQADTIAKWDQTIVDNSAKIDKLYVKTRTCEKQTMSVEMQLSAVENQQSELDAWLTKYENEVEEMQAKDNANPAELGGPDQERERTYKLAEKLQERLDDMGRDLETMVEEVNAANASLHKNGKADEPITQIVRILNTHLSQLRAIDQGTAALQKKMADAQKAAHGLAYLPGAKSEARAAVDDFYRSYIGRQ